MIRRLLRSDYFQIATLDIVCCVGAFLALC